MNPYQKLWSWFRGLNKWVQVGIVTVASAILIIGVWFTSFGYETRNAADLTNSTGWMVSVFLKLLIVLVLIYGLAIVLKRWMATSASIQQKKMRIVESLPLNPKRSLHIVKVGEKTFLIGSTDQQVNLIHDLTAEEMEVEFPEALAKAVQKAGIGGLDE
jgi:flagellar biosynthetic protein FliO